MGLTKDETLALLKEKIDQHGDLPVFSASVNHICSVSSDPEADVMSLSQEVLKDANLSTKLLRLANSPYYARGTAKIGVVSRAIIVLGFDTVKNLSLTMKFIESFQDEHPSIEMDKLLVRSYLSAGFVRNVALNLGIQDAEETYTCALLHDLGEVSVATYLPEKYVDIITLAKESREPAETHERKVLGASFRVIGKELAESWDFSSKVVATMDSAPADIRNQITKPNELNRVLSSLSSQIVGSLYSSGLESKTQYQDLMTNLANATGFKRDKLEDSLSESFKMSCELAKTYGISARKLMPAVADTKDESRDKLARQFSFFVSSMLPKANTSSEASSAPGVESQDTATATEAPSNESDQHTLQPMLQLQYIQDITSLITDSAKLNTVLIKVLEGIHTAAGFPRVSLCLISPDRKSYVARIAIGEEKDLIKTYFQRLLKPKNDIFSRVVMENVDIFVEDSSDGRWQNVLPTKFLTEIGAKSFVAAPLKSRSKPLGFVYADKGRSSHPISAEQHRAFTQFVAQARLALQTCR